MFQSPSGAANDLHGAELLLRDTSLFQGLQDGDIHALHQGSSEGLELLQAQSPVVVKLFGGGREGGREVGRAMAGRRGKAEAINMSAILKNQGRRDCCDVNYIFARFAY